MEGRRAGWVAGGKKSHSEKEESRRASHTQQKPGSFPNSLLGKTINEAAEQGGEEWEVAN